MCPSPGGLGRAAFAFAMLGAAAQAEPPSAVTTYEAEDQSTSGKVVGPSFTFGTLAAEASGRRAVRLDNAQESLDVTIRAMGRGLTIRYSLPDSADGAGTKSTAVILIDGVKALEVPLTSRYAYFYGVYPFSNRPAEGRGHRFWDEVRVLLPRTIEPGARLGVSPAPGVPGFALDLLETEPVPPPVERPKNAVSVLAFGADPTGRISSGPAFRRAIAVARGRHSPLYIPPGRYSVDGHVVVDRVVIVGAGQWYSKVSGHHVGFYSRNAGSRNVSLTGFAIESDVVRRQDRQPWAAIGGSFNRARFTDLYLHHAKVGIWLDGPAHDLIIRNVTIADQAADGINLHRGITRAVVERNRIRNSGDDGIASWADRLANSQIVIADNDIVAPGLANGIALYGGHDIDVIGNRIADTVTEGGGIHLGTRFRSAPFSGTINIANNTIIRSGSMDPHWHFGLGSIWLYALEKPISARIVLANNVIEDSPCEAIQLLGPRRIDGVKIENLLVRGPATSLFSFQTNGSLTAAGVVVEPRGSLMRVELPEGFALSEGPANRGWRPFKATASHSPTCN